MTPIVIPVVKGTDFDYFKALQNIAETETAKTFGLNQLRFLFPNSIHPPIENIDFQKASENAILKRIFEAQGRVLQSIVLFGAGGSVTLNRNDNFDKVVASNGYYDKLQIAIDASVDQARATAFPILVADAQNAVKRFSVSGLSDLLGAESSAHFNARENALSRLENIQAKLLYDFEALKQKHYVSIDEKRASLDKTLEERKTKLEEEYRTRQVHLDSLRAALEEEKAKLDDRSSTHVRRDLREKLKKTLTDRQTSFALSSDTHKRRYWVLGGYIVLLIALAGIAITFLVLESRSTSASPNYWYIGRQLGSTITFFLTMGFFLAWMNRWAQQHAEEEFKLKQLEIDIDRASWVVETALAWDETTKNPLPQQLLNTLSTNLFGQKNDTREVAMTAGDAIAKSLAGIPNANAEIHFPGGKITLDKKALQQVKKSDAKDQE